METDRNAILQSTTDILNQDPILHCFILDNPFHLKVRQDMEEKICSYLCYIVTLNPFMMNFWPVSIISMERC